MFVIIFVTLLLYTIKRKIKKFEKYFDFKIYSILTYENIFKKTKNMFI